MATLLQRGFTREGYSVDVADDGHDGLWLATENEYAAIVLDVLLPGLDGVTVCRRLRADNRWAPILLLTARARGRRPCPGARCRCRRLRHQALQLPRNWPHGSVRWFADVWAPARPSCGSAILRLDPATHRAWRGETELQLSPKEMSLLEMFLRHPGEVLTRTHILDHVWDFAYDGGSNVVDQYVGYLRKKIDRPFGRADIETVRGVGYRLGASVPSCSVSIRVRLAIACAAATLVIFTVAGLLFLRSFHRGLETQLDPGLRVQADSLTGRVRSEAANLDLEARTDAVRTNDVVAQVLTGSGRVVTATREAGPAAVVDGAVIRRMHGQATVARLRLGGERVAVPRPRSMSRAGRSVTHHRGSNLTRGRRRGGRPRAGGAAGRRRIRRAVGGDRRAGSSPAPLCGRSSGCGKRLQRSPRTTGPAGCASPERTTRSPRSGSR